MARRSAHSTVQPAPSQGSASDAEGDESQRMLALSSLLQTPKPNHKGLQEFKAMVAADQQELEALLAQRVRQAEQASMRRRNELTEAILKALQTPNRPVQGPPHTFGESKIARNAVFASGFTVLRASKDLMNEYVRLDMIILGMRDAEPECVAEQWTEEVERSATLLKIGADAALRNVKKVLGAEFEEGDVYESTLVEDGETMEALEQMELNYELQKGLSFVERGVKEMVKGLPEPEEA